MRISPVTNFMNHFLPVYRMRVQIDKDCEYERCSRSFIFHCLRVLKSVCNIESNIKIKLSRLEATAMLGMNKLRT